MHFVGRGREAIATLLSPADIGDLYHFFRGRDMGWQGTEKSRSCNELRLGV